MTVILHAPMALTLGGLAVICAVIGILLHMVLLLRYRHPDEHHPSAPSTESTGATRLNNSVLMFYSLALLLMIGTAAGIMAAEPIHQIRMS